MGGMNEINMSGNITYGPEIKETKGGDVTEFGIAINKKRKKGEEWVDHASFVDCVCWGSRGDSLAAQFNKGQEIQIHGSWDDSSWETKEGEKRKSVKVNVGEWYFSGPKID